MEAELDQVDGRPIIGPERRLECLIADQVGSVRLVVNISTGAVAERVDYGEFGDILNDTAPGTQPFGFAGGLRDIDTGLTRFGARDYDPTKGRWVAKDPLRFGGGLLNLYSYVRADPVNHKDPTGLWVFGIGLSIGGQFLWWGGDLGGFVVIDSNGSVGAYFDWDMRVGFGFDLGKGPTGFYYPNMSQIEQLSGVTVGGGVDTPLACVQGLKNPTTLVPGSPWYGGFAAGTGALGLSAYVLGGTGQAFPLFSISK